MNLIRLPTWLPAILLMLPFAVAVYGDSGVIRLQEMRGSWRVTLFTSPESSVGRATELAVLVQDRTNGELVLDAEVTVSLIPPAGAPEPILDVVCGMTGARLTWDGTNGLKQTAALRAIRGQASNRLLYATSVVLPAAGLWKWRSTIERRGERVEVETELAVSPVGSRLASIGWMLVAPPVLIALFACHQWLRRNSGRGHPC